MENSEVSEGPLTPAAPRDSEESNLSKPRVTIIESPTLIREKSSHSSLSLNTEQKFLKANNDIEIGTPVREGHANYMLMYDMLTGIRISVSRCNAKSLRSLVNEDYTAAHKIAFDITGNELTPTSEYDFKFKDYAPWVFRHIRECFRLDPTDYLVILIILYNKLSLTGKYVLTELGSPGKSGSFFYYSQDYRFIIKTIHHNEHQFLRKKLSSYLDHISLNANTLICRIYGLHRVKLPGNRKIHFVVMGNVLPPNKDIHEIYDLKGSLKGRLLSEKEAINNPRAVLKDMNWINRKKKIVLGPEKQNSFLTQLQIDVKFLEELGTMDYSILIGVHDIVKGNGENIRDNTLAVFEPSSDVLNRSLSVRTPTLKRINDSKTIKKIINVNNPIQLGPSSSRLPDIIPLERRHTLFYQDEGGLRATYPDNSQAPFIYYVGIIDILTEYSLRKRAETFFKSIFTKKKNISAVQPKFYGKRFLKFVKCALDTSF